MKADIQNQPFETDGQPVASFGTSNRIRRRDSHWELHGGEPGDHAEAHELRSISQHEATFSSDPLPVGTGQELATSARSRKRVLIADDDPAVRGSLVAVLESEGYIVDEARNGIEAVTRSIEHVPDLILLDLNMPQWDGWTAFSQLDRVAPLLPVVIITARPNQYQKAVRLGVDAFMEKPLNIATLIEAIGRLCSEDRSRRVARVTSRTFVTELLGNAGC